MKIAIIGGGAAGMFCAANINPDNNEVVVLESGRDLLRKVEQSGGGRCNITNAEPDVEKFIQNYPRGGGRLRKPLRKFGNRELADWFNERGVNFIKEKDGRVFPESEDSNEIIDCLLRECRKRGVIFRMPFTATSVEKQNEKFIITGRHGDSIAADKIIFAFGGKWNADLQESLEKFGHKFHNALPSLFPLKTNFKKLTDLAGATLKNAVLRYPAQKLESSGDLLITHEGISGPCALKMSSLGARIFNELDYKFILELAAISDVDSFKNFCAQAREYAAKKLVKNFYPEEISQGYWIFALEKSIIPSDKTWAQFSADEQKRLTQTLSSLPLQITGRAANAREFVTCGGIDLGNIDFNTMQSKKTTGLFFAGECLDIDAFTGGYNLQAAWTTAKLAADACSIPMQ